MDTFIDLPVASAASIEVHLKNSWNELLDADSTHITPDSNFFALGGNSMLLLSLHVTVSTQFNISVTLAELLENADFGCMASLLFNKVVNRM